MNTNLLNIVKRIIAEQGEDILGNPQRLKAFFMDYAKDEPKSERVAFGRCIEMGAYGELKNTGSADARERKKEVLADQLHTKTGIDKRQCADALDLLEAVVFGEALAEKPKKNFCKNCGKELQAEWTACPFCGVVTENLLVLSNKKSAQDIGRSKEDAVIDSGGAGYGVQLLESAESQGNTDLCTGCPFLEKSSCEYYGRYISATVSANCKMKVTDHGFHEMRKKLSIQNISRAVLFYILLICVVVLISYILSISSIIVTIPAIIVSVIFDSKKKDRRWERDVK